MHKEYKMLDIDADKNSNSAYLGAKLIQIFGEHEINSESRNLFCRPSNTMFIYDIFSLNKTLLLEQKALERPLGEYHIEGWHFQSLDPLGILLLQFQIGD